MPLIIPISFSNLGTQIKRLKPLQFSTVSAPATQSATRLWPVLSVCKHTKHFGGILIIMRFTGLNIYQHHLKHEEQCANLITLASHHYITMYVASCYLDHSVCVFQENPSSQDSRIRQTSLVVYFCYFIMAANYPKNRLISAPAASQYHCLGQAWSGPVLDDKPGHDKICQIFREFWFACAENCRLG